MIEPNIAELWQRAQSRTAPWDAANARAQLLALGFDPRAPLPEVETKSDEEGGDTAPFATPSQAAAPEQMSAAREDSGAPGPRVRGDDEEGDDEEEDRDDDLPPFVTPAPAGAQQVAAAAKAKKPRHREWTRAKMAGFLRELAACQNVSQAARSVGMGRQSAYKLRDRMGGTPFALAWEVALESGVQQLAHALMDRALNGEEVPVFYQGERVGAHRKYDNRLATWLIENHGRLGRQQVARRVAMEAGEWEALIERVEWDSADWYPGEELQCAPPPFQAIDETGEGEHDWGLGESDTPDPRK